MFKMKNAPVVDDVPTTELYVPRVILRTSCVIHEVETGEPCHEFESLISDTIVGGICNARARRAGMNAPIRPASLDRSLSGQSYRGNSPR